MKCECGCGEEVKEGNRFVLGHNNRGIKLSEETKQKIRGFKHTDKTKRKMSEVNKGNQHRLGCKHTEETKRKIGKKSSRYKHSDKIKRKIAEATSGENSPHWRGGISFEPYCSKFNSSFKELIRNKFGRACFLCGVPENGRKLDVHHVNYDKECLCSEVECAFVPLCRSCHAKTTNGDREYWENLILEKLEVI